MSFAAVTALITSHEFVSRLLGRGSRPHPALRVIKFFGEIVSSTLIASVAVAPFAAYNFHQSQQYAVLANMIAIPICNIIVMPAALVAFVLMPFGLEVLGLKPMGWGIEGMTWCANAVGSLPGAVGHIREIPTIAFALMLAGGVWLALWQTRVRLLGAALVLVGLIVAPWMPRPDILVGQKGAACCGTRTIRQARGAARERLEIRSRPLARIRRRRPERFRGAAFGGILMRCGRLHCARQRRGHCDRASSGSHHRRLRQRRRADARYTEAGGLRRARHCH